MESNGRTYWKTPQGVACGSTDIDSVGISFTLVKDEDTQALPDGFALEAWGQAAYFLIGEQRVLSVIRSLRPRLPRQVCCYKDSGRWLRISFKSLPGLNRLRIGRPNT
jgi:hypothetical protein